MSAHYHLPRPGHHLTVSQQKLALLTATKSPVSTSPALSAQDTDRTMTQSPCPPWGPRGMVSFPSSVSDMLQPASWAPCSAPTHQAQSRLRTFTQNHSFSGPHLTSPLCEPLGCPEDPPHTDSNPPFPTLPILCSSSPSQLVPLHVSGARAPFPGASLPHKRMTPGQPYSLLYPRAWHRAWHTVSANKCLWNESTNPIYLI